MRGWMLARARRSAFKSGLVPAGGKARNPGQGGDGRPTRDLPGPWRGSEARGASAGLGATARERRGQHPAPRASPGGSFTGISLRGVTAVPSPGRFFAASSPRRSAPGPPAWPGAPRAQPPEVRAGGPGEEPEKPIGANQVSEPLLLGTRITRDELYLPDDPLFLTAHPSPEEKRGRCRLDRAQAFPGGFLWMPRRGRPSAAVRSC
ncbi:protein eva-1 homolog A isoform X2 [Mustela putorius furo]|uniref:Protein eva-1 homolog A isoform X2 n=1 Tax=Mustela putorius furo TaxID=9669 RepID=A0A8U0TAS8_MUSPF|nr:protein eva-1 homolog A isoform X2 [Mustela putorius furo]XP_044935011.1 protein eva-1 homolog A isoform X2 [Mustela putorius furo]